MTGITATTIPLSTSERTRLLILIGILYFTQGLPMGLAMEALPVMMRQNGVSLDIIALVPLAGLPWILKLFWATTVDNHWSARLGRRRSWIIPMQVILAACLLVTGFLPLGGTYVWLAFAALTIGSIASATQDTATDGLAAEQLSGRGLAHANALQIGGMMAGFMVGGGGVLLLADPLGQTGIFMLLAVFPLISIVTALSWREPVIARLPNGDNKARLAKTFRRKSVGTLLVLAFIYGGAHAGGLSVSKIFLVDLGWSNSETGLVSTISGTIMVLIGCPIGSYLTMCNRWRAISAGMFLAAVAFILWGLLAAGTINQGWASVLMAISVLSIASGIIAVSAATIIMTFGGAGQQAGTDVTVLQSANVLGEMVIAGLVVWIAALSGYAMTFTGAAIALAIIAIVVLRVSRSVSTHI